MPDNQTSVTRPAINPSGTRPPGSTDDITQGWTPGSMWIDTVNFRVWFCVSNNTNNALWAVCGGVPYLYDTVSGMPGTALNQFGSGTGTFFPKGLISKYTSNTGLSPAGTGGDYVISAYTIPASSLDGITNRGVKVEVWGKFANNGNTKQVKISFNAGAAVVGSLITLAPSGIVAFDTGSFSTSAATGFYGSALLMKYNAAESNNQMCVSGGGWTNIATLGGGTVATASPQGVSGNESGGILVAVTANAGSTATDIIVNQILITAIN